jgi:serine/threonine protein phosphatase PrpC
VFVSAAPAQTLDEQTAADDEPEWEFGEAGLQGPRDSMEDFTSIIPDGRCGFLVASLFDGHAGSHAADWLNTRLYELFSEAINEEIVNDRSADEPCEVEGLDKATGLCTPMGLREVLSQSFQHADDLLLEELKGLEDEEERMAGSTATVALVRRDKIIVANVGDSRAVLCRNGRPVDLTTEHRVYGKGPVVEAEKARVEAAGGWVADGRVCDVIAVSRAFGDLQFKEEAGRKEMLQFGVEIGQWDQEFADSVHFSESPVIVAPDVTELKLEDDDEFVVIASDGLWDVMGSRDVIQFSRTNFKKKMNAQDVADKLAEVAVRRHTADNVAVIVLDLGGGKAGWGGAKKSKQPGLLSRMFK